MHRVRTIAALCGSMLTLAAAAPAQAPPVPGNSGGRSAAREALLAMPRPIDMHDTVWIEEMTLLEVRDLLKAGKTTAMIFAGGMEDNGPYVTVSQHNGIIRAMCDSIARTLGNALCAPIVGLAPGTPERSVSP